MFSYVDFTEVGGLFRKPANVRTGKICRPLGNLASSLRIGILARFFPKSSEIWLCNEEL